MAAVASAIRRALKAGGAVARADPVLEVVDDGVQRRRIHQTLLDHQRFEGLDPQRHVGGRLLAVIMIVRMVVMVVRHADKLARPRQKVKGRQVTRAKSPAMLAGLGGSQPWPRPT
jgi:hypothetical protein